MLRENPSVRLPTLAIIGFVELKRRAARVHRRLHIRRARPVDISQHYARSTTGSYRRHTAECGVHPRDHREAYPDDKYLPSFLVRGESEGSVFHAHIAT